MVNTSRRFRPVQQVFYLFLFYSFIMLAGCDSDNQLGLDIQPPGDELNAEKTDTFSIVAYSKIADSIRTDETAQSLAGYYTDPVFGSVKASFCSQVRLSGTDVDFGDHVVIDSVVLHLEYYSVYGNTKQNNTMTFEVYELASSISSDSAYYSFSPIDAGRKLGSKTFIPNAEDSMVIGTETYAPQLRIPLSKNLGKRFVEAAENGYMGSNALFQDFFHGFCVIPTSQNPNGSIVSFDVLSTLSGLTMYYHNDDDTSSFTFNITYACARYEHFDHFAFAGANPSFLSQVNGDTALGQQKLYLQPLGGTEIFLNLPKIKGINSGFSVVINRAELVVPADINDITEKTYPRPAKLTLVKLDKDGHYQYVSSYDYETSAIADAYSATYDKNTHSYRFLVSRHLQDIITGGEELYGYVIIVSGTSVYGNRAILNGPESTDRMRLEVTYTLIN